MTTKTAIAKNATASNAPAAPDTSISLVDMWQSGINMIHVLATATGPVTAAGSGRRLSLEALVKRHIAQTVPSDGTRMYVLSSHGEALAAVLWPHLAAAKPARKPRIRKTTTDDKLVASPEQDGGK